MNTSTKHTTRALKYTFSEDELRDLARDLAESTARTGELDAERVQMMAEIKSRLADNERTRLDLARKYRDGWTWKSCPITVISDYDHGEVRTYRDDSGELLETRAMSPEERQTDLYDVE